ncbi:uncharacterized protein J3R85_002787 [Psidium guajava]|nr:uncharacterized protein J3R85_002787 [Psidium guajava]
MISTAGISTPICQSVEFKDKKGQKVIHGGPSETSGFFAPLACLT